MDLAAEEAGNCALTERDKIVEKFGSRFSGRPISREPHRSPVSVNLYAGPIHNVVANVFDRNKGAVALNLEDELDSRDSSC